jgi:Domain of unknown function (DUF4149)
LKNTRALLTLLVCLWTGAVLAIAFIAAPSAFAMLADRAMAGAVAAHMFKAEAYGTLLVAMLAWMMIRPRDDVQGTPKKVPWKAWIALLIILIATVIGYFALTPQMQDIKLAQGATSAAYAQLHGMSMALYALKAIAWVALSVMLIWRLSSTHKT